MQIPPHVNDTCRCIRQIACSLPQFCCLSWFPQQPYCTACSLSQTQVFFLLQYHYSQLKRLCQSHIVLSGTFSFTHRGNLAYETNYCAGLRILDISGIKADPPDIKEVGYFDVDPDCDTPGFMGSWSNYPFFESRTIIVSSIERGLFVLKYTGPQVHDSFC